MTTWLGGESATLILVTVWWVALFVWRIAATATSRRVWSALAAFALSATLYVGPVSRFAASMLGSSKPCDQFENLWGVAVSGLVVVALCVWTNRALALSVAAVTVVATIGMAVLASTTAPSPVGCVATLSIPWFSPYWWIITITHVGAALAAAAVCIRDAIAIGHHDRVAAIAVGGVAAGFLSSAAFWLLIWISLVTESSAAANWGSLNIFPLTVLCMTVCSVLAAVDTIVAVLRHRNAIVSAWRNYRREFELAHPDMQAPRRWDVVGPWWVHPMQSLHQLRIQTDDLALVHRERLTPALATEASDGGNTTA